MSNTQIVMDFIDAWNRMDWDAVVAAFSEDVVYHNIPMEELRGKAVVAEFVTTGMDLDAVDWQVLSIAENGNKVLTERVDNFLLVGGKTVAMPVMGTFEIADGQIAKHCAGYDLVLTEGYKRGDFPKIEVHRAERSNELLCEFDEMLALVTDAEWDTDVPQFSLGDAEGVATLLVTWLDSLAEIRTPLDLQFNVWMENNGNDAVLDYLSRYVFRTAISNSRILRMDDTHVTFRYKDRTADTWRSMRLPGVEFLRRFLTHVLPRGFHRVRYYGLWHHSKRKQASRAWQLLILQKPVDAVSPTKIADLLEALEQIEALGQLTQLDDDPYASDNESEEGDGPDNPCCPHCGSVRTTLLGERPPPCTS